MVGIGGFDRITFTSTADETDDPDPPGSTRFRGDRWTGGGSWQRLLGTRGVGTLRVSASTSANTIRVIDDAFPTGPVFVNDARENEYTARYDVLLAFPSFADISAGASLKRISLRSELQSPFGVNNPFSSAPGRVDAIDVNTTAGGNIAAGYAELTRTFGRVDVTGSARVDHFARSSDTRLSPRASATIHVAEALALSGTWGRYHQQVPLVYSVNVAANADLAPMQSDHAVLSARWTPAHRSGLQCRSV